MECNKEVANRGKEIAQKMMQDKDFAGARKIALKAQQLYSNLENISQMLTVCEVHCSSELRVLGTDMDWYSILQLDQTADEASIKKQYRKLALLLHTDKNKFAGAEAAFKLIGEAQSVLSDPLKRSVYDMKYKASLNTTASMQPPQRHQNMNTRKQPVVNTTTSQQQPPRPPTQPMFNTVPQTFSGKQLVVNTTTYQQQPPQPPTQPMFNTGPQAFSGKQPVVNTATSQQQPPRPPTQPMFNTGPQTFSGKQPVVNTTTSQQQPPRPPTQPMFNTGPQTFSGKQPVVNTTTSQQQPPRPPTQPMFNTRPQTFSRKQPVVNTTTSQQQPPRPSTQPMFKTGPQTFSRKQPVVNATTYQQPPRPPTQRMFNTGPQTFWTACPLCNIKYQYKKDKLNRAMQCQGCMKRFIACDLNVQAAPLRANWSQSAARPQSNQFPSQTNFHRSAGFQVHFGFGATAPKPSQKAGVTSEVSYSADLRDDGFVRPSKKSKGSQSAAAPAAAAEDQSQASLKEDGSEINKHAVPLQETNMHGMSTDADEKKSQELRHSGSRSRSPVEESLGHEKQNQGTVGQNTIKEETDKNITDAEEVAQVGQLLEKPKNVEPENFAESDPVNRIGKPAGTEEQKKKMPSVRDHSESSQRSRAVRKCLHCEIIKTPQWRAGPLGPKTLCNACGVRYKSGRLFPEYRPAASPTFVASLHSNSHRKVLGMRVKDDTKKTPPPDILPRMTPR